MNYNELIAFKNIVCQDYINHYKKDGYVIMPPLPLDYKEDVTLDFTTCTICMAKENIRLGKKKEDYVVIQPALRNTHINTLKSNGEEDYFFSFFKMMGGFKYYNDNIESEFSNIIKKEFLFLKKYSDRVILTIPIQYKDYLKINEEVTEFLKNNGCFIKYSIDDLENLKWKYGINGVIGYGTRWEISNGGPLINWGNTINVLKDNKPFGIDFGGGVESLITSTLNLDKPLYANDTMLDSVKDFCDKNIIREKIIDCITSSMCIIASKDTIILRDRYILCLYMKLLVAMMIIENINEEIIFNIVNDINEKEIEFLYKDKMLEIFSNYYEKAKQNFDIILNSKYITKILKLIDVCYNEYDNEWMKKKRIVRSHYLKYFTNLSEVELLALKKKGIKND